jgi:hypothetical protein
MGSSYAIAAVDVARDNAAAPGSGRGLHRLVE